MQVPRPVKLIILLAAGVLIQCGGSGNKDKNDGGDGTCGNGMAESSEVCDGTDLRGETCASATMNAMSTGVLACSSSCTFDTSGCMSAAGGAAGGGGMGP